MKELNKIFYVVIALLLVFVISIIYSKNNSNVIVTFDTNGGSEINNYIVKKGKKILEPDDPVKEGYTFKEWQLNGEAYDFNTSITNNITLKAIYIKYEAKTYTVSFDSDGGNIIESQEIEAENKVTKPDDPVKEGYTFIGWTLNERVYDFNSKIKNDITLKAIYIKNEAKTYTVKFDSNGGNVISNQTIEENKNVIVPINPTKNGYTFKEWQLNGKAYDFNTPVTNNLTLKAIYIKNEVKKYNISFDCNGGSGAPSMQTATYNKPFTLTSLVCSTPKKGYYQKKGDEWALNADSTGSSWNTNNIKKWTWNLKNDVLLYAKWTAKTYTITFDCNGGTDAPKSEKVLYGNKYTLTNQICKKEGYTQIKWIDQNNVSWTASNTKNLIWTYDHNVVLKAVYKEEIPSINVSKNNYTMKTGDKISLSYSISPSNLSNKTVTYKSSNNNVVKVDSLGNVTAIGAGSANVTIQLAQNSSVNSIINFVVDYPYFDKCSQVKQPLIFKTSNNKSVNVYACLENQNFFSQGFAVSDDSIYYSGVAYATWCKVDKTYNLEKYNLTGPCLENDYGTLLYTSGNKILKYDKKTGKLLTNYIDVAGHGQGFDVSNTGNIYINYFPHTFFSKTYGYGAGNTGVAYINKMIENKQYLSPSVAIKTYKNGNIKKFSSNNNVGTTKYNEDVLKMGNENGSMKWLEFGVDEENDKIASMVSSEFTQNNNNIVYIYKLSDFKKGIKTLINTIYIGKICFGGNISCSGQGIDLYGNYIYSVQEKTINKKFYISVNKIDYTKCPTNDNSNKKCVVEEVNIDASKYGNDNGKIVGLSEAEGISIYKGKVYVNVITNYYSDGRRRNYALLVDGI